MLDCTKTCWPCQVQTISSAKCNAWIRWRATPQTVLRNGVQVCYCDNMRGRWVQTSMPKTPIALARTKTPSMNPITCMYFPKEKKSNIISIVLPIRYLNKLTLYDFKHFWLFSSISVFAKMSTHQSAKHHWLLTNWSIPVLWHFYLPHIFYLYCLMLWRQGSNVNWFHSYWSYPRLDRSSATQVGRGETLSWWRFLINAGLLIPALLI